MTHDPRKQTVARGYDALAPRWLQWRDAIVGDPRNQYLDRLFAHVPDGSRVLDIGCGSGEPRLAEHYDLVGVDISAEQLRLARERLPEATFIHADITETDFDPESFDAIVALYSLSHVPRDELATLLARVTAWLRPGGVLVAVFGVEGFGDWAGEWLGETMFFSSWDADTNRRLVRDAGLSIRSDDLVTIREPEGDVTFLWIVAEKEA